MGDQKSLCGAKTRSGSPCRKRPVSGCQRCRNHGAGAGRPPVTGKYSRFVPANLQADLERALNDPELLSLNFEMAACESRISQLMKDLVLSTPGTAWKEAQKLYDEAITGTPNSGRSMEHLGVILKQGMDDATIWVELQKLFELRRRLSQTEVKREEKLEQFMTKKQAAALGAAMMQTIRKYIKDQNTRQMFIHDIAMLINRSPRR